VSNHQSAWETIALGVIVPLPQTWVMKKELLRIPFFGWALALFKPIAIRRSSGHQALHKVLEAGAERLRDGHSVIIFPEGTRVPPNENKRFGFGAARLAALTGAPVVPIAHNAGYFWPKRFAAKVPGTIDVVIGEPIATTGHSAASINRLSEQWIKETRGKLSGPADLPSERPTVDSAV
jgi:1-acyl-sn-glycerol-3-phosphate acyltransferase